MYLKENKKIYKGEKTHNFLNCAKSCYSLSFFDCLGDSTEKIYANDKVSVRRIKEENEKKISNGGSVGGQGGYKSQACVHLDAPLNKDRDRTTNTREQRAKLSGVSTGTVARYDTVMNSDNKELQQSMLSGDDNGYQVCVHLDANFFLFLYQLQSKYNNLLASIWTHPLSPNEFNPVSKWMQGCLIFVS